MFGNWLTGYTVLLVKWSINRKMKVWFETSVLLMWHPREKWA